MSAIIIGIAVVLLILRISLGIDLTDEAYYASFVDGWLKTGLANGDNLMLHQTAALLLYPFVLLFHLIRGSQDGLVFFLRALYVVFATLSSLTLYRALSYRTSRIVAAFTAAFALLFVPFSLPAPSYNTIGMYSLVGALALFASAFARLSSPQKSGHWLPKELFGSAVYWGMGCMAYPSMLAPLCVLLVTAYWMLRYTDDRRLVVRYALVCLALLLVVALVLCVAFTPQRLWEMFRFTNAFNGVTGGLERKVHLAESLFIRHQPFIWLCIAALLVSIVRPYLSTPGQNSWVNGLLFALIAANAFTSDATFFLRSHDLVLLLALAGIWPAIHALLFQRGDRNRRVFALISTISFVAGVTTSVTAFNGLYNFAVGALLAACCTLVTEDPRVNLGNNGSPVAGRTSGKASRLQMITAIGACVVVAESTFTFYYGQGGEPLTHLTSVVSKGAFEGIRSDKDQVEFIERMTESLSQTKACGNLIATVGNGPAFYLMSAMAPSALSTWDFAGNPSSFAGSAITTFHADPVHRPEVIVVNKWQWAAPLTSSDRQFLDNYRIAASVSAGRLAADIYRRNTCVPSS